MSIPNIVILSAGAGFRLQPFSLYRPKSLCTVANVPLLKHQLLQLQAAGFSRSAIFLSRRFTGLKNLLSELVPTFHLDTMFPREGGEEKVSLVRRAIGSDPSPVMVIYGDSFLEVDFREFVECHQRNVANGGLATILYHRPKDIRIPERDGRTYHGVLSVAEDGRITRFVEKPEVADVCVGFDLANAAVFIIERELLDLPAFEQAKDFSFDLFEPAVKQGLAIFGCDIGKGFRFDVGGIGRWHELNLSVIRKEIYASLPGVEGPPSVWIGNRTEASLECIKPPVLLGDDVLISANAKIGPEVIIGNRCRIEDNATIQHSVIMEHCLIGSDARVDSSLIGPHCKIAKGVRLPRFTVLGAYSVVGNDTWPNWAEEKEFQYE